MSCFVTEEKVATCAVVTVDQATRGTANITMDGYSVTTTKTVWQEWQELCVLSAHRGYQRVVDNGHQEDANKMYKVYTVKMYCIVYVLEEIITV